MTMSKEDKLKDAIMTLLNCPALNYDELEDVDLEAIRIANKAMED